MSESPGRICPLRYRYGAAALATAPEKRAKTLYVIGGLYGNRLALDAVEALAAAEPGPATFCFNGDFHWFDVDDATFVEIGARVLRHDAILGNVEAELLAESEEAGCGCAYPEAVAPETVERSNRIHARLKTTARRHRETLAGLGTLPMFARYRVGDARIGVVHGDAEALAGWQFDVDALDEPANRERLAAAFLDAGVDVFASSHTCLPALRRFDLAGLPKWVVNSGAAGMPNFAATRFGVVTRIGVSPSPHPRLYGGRWGSVYLDALALAFDPDRWQREFLANWPVGSPAHASYFARIAEGPAYAIERARTAVPRRSAATPARSRLRRPIRPNSPTSLDPLESRTMTEVTMYGTQICPFCRRAEQLLKSKGIDDLKKIPVDLEPDQMDIMIARTGRRSVPQIFIGETHVGGYDDLAALDRAGRLDALLRQPTGADRP